MYTQKVIAVSSKVFLGFSIFSIGYVSILSMLNPVATMELVNTTLQNTDAISSIRGIYGGVGLAITCSLIYFMLKDVQKGLSFLTMFWGAYAISRVITHLVDGPLGDFGSQWLVIESILFVLALVLLGLNARFSISK